MKLTITIEMDNAAFFDENGEPQRNAEVASILRALAQKIEMAWEMEDGHGFSERDINGNKVCQADVSAD